MKRIALVLAFAAAIGYVALALSSSGSTHATSFNPTTTFAVANPAGGAASNTTFVTNFPSPDANFGGDIVYTFYPPDWKLTPDSGIPNGAGTGTLNAAINIAVGNGACNTPLNPVFNMWDSDTDISDVLDAAAMSWVLKNAVANPVPDVRGEKASDPANGLEDFIDGYPGFLNEMFDPDGPCVVGGNGICDGPSPGPADPGWILPIQPRSRVAGWTTVSNENVLLQFLTFNPNQLTLLPGITAQMTETWGYPSVAVLNNPRDPNPAPSSIADFCTPVGTLINSLGTTTDNPKTGVANDGCPPVGVAGGESGDKCLNFVNDDPTDDAVVNDGCPIVLPGDESTIPGACANAVSDDGDVLSEAGYVRSINPAASTGILNTGTHIARGYAQAYRDSDNDGIETYMDTCPWTNSAAWNPRLPGGPGNSDNDSDGIPNDCDPTPGDTGIGDHDFDSYSNRNDNCPTIANGQTPPQQNQYETEAWASVPAYDLGPKGDQMGDICDTVGAGGGQGLGPAVEDGHYNHMSMWAPVCIGGADSDLPAGDGWCDATENNVLLGGDPNNPNKTPESIIVDLYITGIAGPPGGAVPVTTPGTCSDGIDNDQNGSTDGADTKCQSPSDADKDGYDEVTPPLDNCGKAGTTLVKNPAQTDTDGDGTGDACDNDNDINQNSPALARTDQQEWKMGTDPLDECPDNPTGSAGTMKHDAWPMDLDQSGDISVTGDVFKFRGGPIGKSVYQFWSMRRLDIDGNGDVSVTGDVFLYRGGRIGDTCTNPG